MTYKLRGYTEIDVQAREEHAQFKKVGNLGIQFKYSTWKVFVFQLWFRTEVGGHESGLDEISDNDNDDMPLSRR